MFNLGSEAAEQTLLGLARDVRHCSMLFGTKQRQGEGRKGGTAPASSTPSPSSSWRVAAMLVPGPGSLHGNINVPGVITTPLKTAWHWEKGAWTWCSTSSFFLRTRKRCSQHSPVNREITEAVTDRKLLILRCLFELIFDLAAKQWVVDFVWDLSL